MNRCLESFIQLESRLFFYFIAPQVSAHKVLVCLPTMIIFYSVIQRKD